MEESTKDIMAGFWVGACLMGSGFLVFDAYSAAYSAKKMKQQDAENRKIFEMIIENQVDIVINNHLDPDETYVQVPLDLALDYNINLEDTLKIVFNKEDGKYYVNISSGKAREWMHNTNTTAQVLGR